MSGELDIGQIPDRPATPSTSSETSNNGGNVKPRVNRDEDVADGESKPTDVDAQPGKSDSTSPKTPEAATGDAARKKGKKPAVDYVRPDVAPNQVSTLNTIPSMPSTATVPYLNTFSLLFVRINCPPTLWTP